MSMDARLHVLADRSLFSAIAAFATGASYSVYRVRQRLRCKPGSRFLFWPENIALWQDAVLARDTQTLDALRELCTRYPFRDALCEVLRGILGFAVAHSTDMAMLDAIYTGFPDAPCRSICREHMEALVAKGDVALVQWTFERHRAQVDWLCAGTVAATHGHLAILAFLYDSAGRFWISPDAMDVAAANGHLDVVHYLHENRIKSCTERAMDVAATNGHLEIVRFLHERRTEGCTTRAMDGAATNGHVATVRYLHEHRAEGCSKQALLGAATNGHVAVLAFLHPHRCAVSRIDDALRLATEHGHVACVQYLLPYCRAVRPETLAGLAAAAGQLACVQFFLASGAIPLARKTLHQAAIAGHVHVVRFLHETRGERCSVKTLLESDKRAHHAVVAYLCSQHVVENHSRALERATRLGRAQLVAALVAAQTNVVVGSDIAPAMR